MSNEKKVSDEKVLREKEDALYEVGKEKMKSAVLYGLLDGTICSSREQAITANSEMIRDLSNGH